MAEFSSQGRFAVPQEILTRAQQDFAAFCLDDAATKGGD